MYILRCPTCEREQRFEHVAEAVHRPFCSRRCQLIDLHKWFDGQYRVSEPLGPTDAPATPLKQPQN